ncbi:hypothetical protein BDN71DRAFT_1428549 [Pleurotus eryngii]|uniref:Uncharacterized protein n=1 Tax=Pleurotus eryngii TaxID=5323 RepID=A0A9P6DJ70_PLEER|nr:hypothetical protein BDN71DRAFT_1428549 [Pleurotus eryngii]
MSHINMTSTPVSSVFSELSTVPSLEGEVPSVTDLIRLLLQVVTQDVCLLKHNMMSLYLLLSRLRDICGELHNLIQRVDETGDWENYESYSSKVLLLEKTGLGLIEGQSSNNFNWAKKHDDLALFHTVLEGMHKQFAAFATVTYSLTSHYTSSVTPSFISSEAYTTIQAKVKGFESQFASDTGAQPFVIATKFVMVMEGLLAFIADKSQVLEKQRDLLGGELQKAAKDIIEKLDQPSWNEFVRLLSNAAPSDIKDLVKLVKQVWRLFHFQSMVLAKYCYQTLNKVKAEKKEPSILNSTLAATEEALSAAADVVKNNNDLLKFEIDAAKKAVAKSKFTAVTAKITDCITAYTGKHTSVATDLATVKVTITNPPASLDSNNQTFTIEKNCSASMLLSHSLIQLQKDFRGTLPHQCHLADPSKNNEVIAGTTLVNAIPDAIALVFKVYSLSLSLTHLY